MSLFSTLGMGYSGLSASKVGVEVTSHNISNAESDGYTRQRIIQSAGSPLNSATSNVGNGVEVTNVQRLFDNFVYDRYRDISKDKEASDFTKTTLEELSTYFPEVENVGIKYNLSEYYKMWQSHADNPDSDAIKLALTKQTAILADSIRETQTKVLDMQKRLNSELKVGIDEVNSLAKKLASINSSINSAEAGGGYTANDLRDQRNLIERDLSRLIGAKVSVGAIKSNINVHSRANITNEGYSLSVGGFSIVDGSSYHPIELENRDRRSDFFSISYERQDGVLIPMDEDIDGGKIGSILKLRGSKVDRDNAGSFNNGVLQNVVNQLDSFSKGLIQSTNNLYASAATKRMDSNPLDISKNGVLIGSDIGIKEGAFDVVIYDLDGKETARRTININLTTSMTGSNSIESQIESVVDDNKDGSTGNDVNDYIDLSWVKRPDGKHTLELYLDSRKSSKGYTFAIEDKLTNSDYNSGSNFAGALGLNRVFDGSNAHDISLSYDLKTNPTHIKAGKSSSSGDNDVALSMLQQQHEKYDFNVAGNNHNTTMYGMFDIVATDVGVHANEAVLLNQTISAQFKAVELEYSTVSKVSIDEEMTNLIKYQTSYGAASKIITTIDQMMQTLLGIKQ
jgi:flagellar hook-associated protein 1 FlgK